MSKLGKETLISWTSSKSLKTGARVKYFRFRTIAYMVVLAVAVVALALMSTKKENMLLNINRTTELYKIDVDGDKFSVQNAYTFLIQNTQNVEHSYYFDINETRIKIDRPLKPVTLPAGGKRKVIVVLKTSETLVDEPNHDTPLDITVSAYANDAKDIVKVERKTIFVFPKKIELQKALEQNER